jgi:hypothetical protein
MVGFVCFVFVSVVYYHNIIELPDLLFQRQIGIGAGGCAIRCSSRWSPLDSLHVEIIRQVSTGFQARKIRILRHDTHIYK